MRELQNIDVSSYSTFRLPSTAKRLVLLESLRDIEIFFLSDPDATEGNYYLVGDGSNSIFSSNVRCLVKLELKGIEWNELSVGSCVVSASAGDNWNDLVWQSSDRGYWGMESLVEIPGTVGAAPVQNIGAYGKEFSDICVSVSVFDRQEKIFKKMKKDECGFGYRDSIFKRNKNRFIITSVEIVLSRETGDAGIKALSYPGVADALRFVDAEAASCNQKEGGIDPEKICKAIKKVRWSKLPKPDEVPNVGSCFENPIISEEKAFLLKKIYDDMPIYEYHSSREASTKMVKTSAGWLIESCGLKGRCAGGVCIYDRHALVLVNKERLATSDDFEEMVSLVKERVREKFGIELTLEPNRVL